MSHRRSKEKLQQFDSKEKSVVSKKELKRKMREEEKKSWLQKIKERDGFKPKKAKCWGQLLSFKMMARKVTFDVRVD